VGQSGEGAPGGMAAAAMLGSSAIQGGSNLLGGVVNGLFQSGINADNNANMRAMQQASQEFQRQNYDRNRNFATSNLNAAGLPSYLATMPGAINLMPRTSQRLPGGRLYTGAMAGDPTLVNFTGDTLQQNLGWGQLPSIYSSRQ